jgi:hypothetical protein
VKVLHGKGIANHTVPESCVLCCEAQGEALTGVCAGQPLSRESILVQGADAVIEVEGNTGRCDNASIWTALRGRRTRHAHTLLDWEPGDLQLDHGFRVARIGKARSRSR